MYLNKIGNKKTLNLIEKKINFFIRYFKFLKDK